MADLTKQGEQGVRAHGLKKTETIIFKLIWNQRVLWAQLQRKGHTLFIIPPATKYGRFQRRNFYKVDNNAKVRGRKVDELDVMKASFGHPE